MQWIEVAPQTLPVTLRAGLGAEPIYSARENAWFAQQGERFLRCGLGGVAEFDSAANDLSVLVLAPNQAGDAAVASTQYDAAAAAYKTAAANGIGQVASKILGAGSQQVTAPFLAQAAALAAQIATQIPTVGVTLVQAGQASLWAQKMGELYTQAIIDGKASLAPPPSPPQPKPDPKPAPVVVAQKADYTVPIVVGLVVVGAGAIAWLAFKPVSRRAAA